MKKTILQESDQGIIYRIDKIPSSMFDFYILKGRRFKDKTHSYKICVGLSSNPDKCWILAKIRGHKTDAVRALENIIQNNGQLTKH